MSLDRKSLRDAVSALVPTSPGAAGWIRVICPNCEAVDGKRRDNMTINLDTGYFQCWRCHVFGGFGDGADVGAYPRACRSLHIMRADDPGPPMVPLPEGFTALADPAAATEREVMRARAFLLKRGVTTDTANEAGLGIVLGRRKYSQRVVVPVAVDGRVCGFTARLYVAPEQVEVWEPEPDGWREKKVRAALRAMIGNTIMEDPTRPSVPKYLYPKGMNRLAMLNRDALEEVTTEPLALVEGAMDCLPHWPDAMAFLGKPTQAQLEWVAHHARRPVVVVVDGDAWREGAAAARALRDLSGGAIQVGFLRMPAGTDPGATQNAKLRKMVLTALHNAV